MDGSDAELFRTGIGSNYLNYGATYYPYLNTNFPYNYVDTGTNAVQVTIHDGVGAKPDAIALSVLNDLTETNNYNPVRYRAVKDLLDRQRVTLPPSSAVAGAIVTIDNERGVWKAPANISLNAVTSPVLKVDNDTQATLNVDAKAGKSINAIRTFNGKGTLVWGAVPWQATAMNGVISRSGGCLSGWRAISSGLPPTPCSSRITPSPGPNYEPRWKVT